MTFGWWTMSPSVLRGRESSSELGTRSGLATNNTQGGLEPERRICETSWNSRRRASSVVFAFSPAARAIPTDTRSLGCGSHYVVVQSKGQFEVKHYYPSGTLRHTFNNSTLQIRQTHTGSHSTSWKVTANDTLNNTDTKAFCVS